MTLVKLIWGSEAEVDVVVAGVVVESCSFATVKSFKLSDSS